jgi:predicted MFS family arabinose efflux permease
MPFSTIFQLYRGGQFYWWRWVFNAIFNNISVISWRSVLLVEEPAQVADKLCQVMLYRVHHTWVGFKLTMLVVIGTDCIGSYKSNYHRITTTTSPSVLLVMFSNSFD